MYVKCESVAILGPTVRIQGGDSREVMVWRRVGGQCSSARRIVASAILIGAACQET